MLKLLLIGACGGGGALLRYGVSVSCTRWFGEGFPLGTLLVNVAGCFLLGGLYQLIAAGAIPDHWRHPLGVGLLGGLTTFSTFGFETYAAIEKGKWLIAGGNVALNLLLGLAGVWLGIMLVKALSPT